MSIAKMIDRFLAWKLPADFGPDAGISFKPYRDDMTPDSHLWPVGTNLLTATQAGAMLGHVVGACEWTSYYPDEEPSVEARSLTSGCGQEWMSDEDGDPPGKWMTFCPFCGGAVKFAEIENEEVSRK